jgi:hypothetical protein
MGWVRKGWSGFNDHVMSGFMIVVFVCWLGLVVLGGLSLSSAFWDLELVFLGLFLAVCWLAGWLSLVIPLLSIQLFHPEFCSSFY